MKKGKRVIMADCELLSTCSFNNDDTHDLNGVMEKYREQYCRGDYSCCGRYMIFKALERELKKNSMIRSGLR